MIPISSEEYLNYTQKSLKRLKWYLIIIVNTLSTILGNKKADFAKENQLRIISCSDNQWEL